VVHGQAQPLRDHARDRSLARLEGDLHVLGAYSDPGAGQTEGRPELAPIEHAQRWRAHVAVEGAGYKESPRALVDIGVRPNLTMRPRSMMARRLARISATW